MTNVTVDFRALGASDGVCRALAARGIETPFPIQELVVPEALRGGDVLAQSPTGSGKTLAFAIPIVERLDAASSDLQALVLAPTRELAVQVCDEIDAIGRPAGLRTVATYGGVPIRPQASAARTAHAIVATPGRLLDLLERRAVTLSTLDVLVLDEADRMLDMGFRPQVDRIVSRIPADRQTMFFSATLEGEVGELARRYTRHPARFAGPVPEESGAGTIDHRFVPVTADTKVQTLVDILASETGSTLVFVRTKAGADRLVARLRRHEVGAAAIHGGMSQRQRERTLRRFDSGAVRTLVATDVAARGLDVDRITHVVNFDPPEEAAAYKHRVGRTGRAGRAGTGITLVLPEQQVEVSRVARLQGHAEQFQASGMTLARSRLVYSSRRGRRSKW